MQEIFKIIENGKEIEYIIFKKCFYKNNTYIIYHKKNNENDLYASKYYIFNNEIVLDEINSDEEWQYLEKITEE